MTMTTATTSFGVPLTLDLMRDLWTRLESLASDGPLRAVEWAQDDQMMLSSSYESLQAKIAACEEIDEGIRTGLALRADSHSVEGIEYITYCFLSRSCLILCYLVQQHTSIIEKYEPTSHLVFLDGQFQAVEHSAIELVIKKADEIHGVNIACNKENCEDTDHFHSGDGIPWLASVRELEGKLPVPSYRPSEA